MSHDAIELRPAGAPWHEALPVRGTLKRVRDGEQLDHAMPWDFPIVADCAPCGKTIRKKESMFAEWEHVE